MTTRRSWLVTAGCAALLITIGPGAAASVAPAPASDRTAVAAAAPPVLHYAPNHNFGAQGHYRLSRFGFTLADVSSPATLSALRGETKALVYLGLCGGNTQHFRAVVNSYRSAARVFGFYLMDIPDPHTCPARHLAAESLFVHRHVPGAITFIVLDNLSSSEHPDFRGGYTPANSKVDFFGLPPYPCRTETNRCDLQMINRYVRAARRAGIPRTRMIPLYQAFGGGRWRDDGGGRYRLPSARQARAIVCRWDRLVPRPAFDYTYSWGVQRRDTSLASGPAALRRVFAAHNAGRARC